MPGGRVAGKRPAVCPIEFARMGAFSDDMRVPTDDTVDATWPGHRVGAVQAKPLFHKRLWHWTLQFMDREEFTVDLRMRGVR
jgi:hypothetical protein